MKMQACATTTMCMSSSTGCRSCMQHESSHGAGHHMPADEHLVSQMNNYRISSSTCTSTSSRPSMARSSARRPSPYLFLACSSQMVMVWRKACAPAVGGHEASELLTGCSRQPHVSPASQSDSPQRHADAWCAIKQLQKCEGCCHDSGNAAHQGALWRCSAIIWHVHRRLRPLRRLRLLEGRRKVRHRDEGVGLGGICPVPVSPQKTVLRSQ